MVTEAMTVGLPETAEMALDESAYDTVMSLAKDKRCLAVGPGIGTHRPDRPAARPIDRSKPGSHGYGCGRP
jgi:hypothetical protein